MTYAAMTLTTAGHWIGPTPLLGTELPPDILLEGEGATTATLQVSSYLTAFSFYKKDPQP